eukprot:7162425-Prymnesium_polylepis.1
MLSTSSARRVRRKTRASVRVRACSSFGSCWRDWQPRRERDERVMSEPRRSAARWPRLAP